jgi:hypothetical protein
MERQGVDNASLEKDWLKEGISQALFGPEVQVGLSQDKSIPAEEDTFWLRHKKESRSRSKVQWKKKRLYLSKGPRMPQESYTR